MRLVLALILLVPFALTAESSPTQLTRSRIAQLKADLEQARATQGLYPADDKWIPFPDGWNHAFVYSSDGHHYRLSSLGRDGKEGGLGGDMDIVAAK